MRMVAAWRVHVHGSGIRVNRYRCDRVAGVRRVAVMRGGHLAILRSGFMATKESEAAAGDIVPVPGAQFEETLASASPDVLREMIRGFAQKMMDAEVEVRCGAGYGEVSPQRVNSRNGYRPREWDTRAGTIELAIPKLRTGRDCRGRQGGQRVLD